MVAAFFAPETIQAFAAFLSGMGSVLTGWLALRWERKRSKEECDARIAALHEGMVLRDRVDAGKPLEGDHEIQ